MAIAGISPAVPKLTVQVGSSVEHRKVDKTPFTIGRLAENNLSFEDSQISRRHAQIEFDKGSFILVDLHSTHGTFVNGRRVERHVLKAGERITLGLSAISIKFDGSGPSLGPRPIDTSATMLGIRTQTLIGKSPIEELEGLSLFLDAVRQLNATRVVDEVLATLLDSTLRLTKASRGFVYRIENGTPELVTGRDAKGNELIDDSGISRSILGDALHSSSKFLITDTTKAVEFSTRASVIAHDLRSVLCIPLMKSAWMTKADQSGSAKREIQGLLYLDSNYVTSPLNRTGEDVLSAIADEASSLLENARLLEAEEQARIQRHDLEIASTIQQQLMQVKLPDSSFASVEARNIACKEIGGDFYDVVQLPDALAVVLADVSGKGVSSALLASTLQGIICAQLESGREITAIAAWVDQFIARKEVSGKYATMVIAKVHHSGKMEFLNCGHVDGILVRASGVERLASRCVPVGLVPGMTYESETLQLEQGDKLFLVSDGVTEATDHEDKEFGVDRLAAVLGSSPSVAAILDAVYGFASGPNLDDDCTAVSLSFLG
jgi:phosphoserine phosphatase RsbU/P